MKIKKYLAYFNFRTRLGVMLYAWAISIGIILIAGVPLSMISEMM